MTSSDAMFGKVSRNAIRLRKIPDVSIRISNLNDRLLKNNPILEDPTFNPEILALIMLRKAGNEKYSPLDIISECHRVFYGMMQNNPVVETEIYPEVRLQESVDLLMDSLQKTKQPTKRSDDNLRSKVESLFDRISKIKGYSGIHGLLSKACILILDGGVAALDEDLLSRLYEVVGQKSNWTFLIDVLAVASLFEEPLLALDELAKVARVKNSEYLRLPKIDYLVDTELCMVEARKNFFQLRFVEIRFSHEPVGTSSRGSCDAGGGSRNLRSATGL